MQDQTKPFVSLNERLFQEQLARNKKTEMRVTAAQRFNAMKEIAKEVQGQGSYLRRVRVRSPDPLAGSKKGTEC
jgi:hypothetical protein